MILRQPDPSDVDTMVEHVRRLVRGSPPSGDESGSTGAHAARADDAVTERFAALDADTDSYDVEDLADEPASSLPTATVRSRRRARFDPGRRSTVAFAVTAVVSAVIASLVTWLSRPTVEPVPASVTTSVLTPATAGVATGFGPTSPTAAGAPAASAATVVVSVVGRVARPGLVTLPTGARVADAIAACGGALPDTDLTAVNLAAKVADGQQIAVGVPGAAPAAAGPASGGAPAAPDGATPVNLNTADAAALEALPGIGPVLAARIVAFRTKNGPFATVDDLSDVPGVGPAILGNVRDLVTV